MPKLDKSLRRFRNTIWLIPFLVGCFNNVFFNLYLQLFSKVTFSTVEQFNSYLAYGTKLRAFATGWDLILWLVVTYLWARPILQLSREPHNEVLIGRIRRRLENTTYHLFAAIVIFFLMKITRHCYMFSDVILWERFMWVILPAQLLSTASLGSYLLISVQSQVLGQSAIYQAVYPGEELFKPKAGAGFSTVKKVSALFLLFSVFPMLGLSFIHQFHTVAFVADKADTFHFFYTITTMTLFHSTIGVLVGLGIIFHGFSKPIDEIIRKMQGLSKGDFSTKSTIFLNDEIAKLKWQFNQTVDALEERERMRDLFGRFLSQDIARKLLEEGKVNLGGESIEAAVLFSDIRSFTTMSEKMTPTEIVEFLNQYFSFITEPILENHGVINKYIGDCVMVVFSPVFGVQNYSRAAVDSALGMRQRLAEFNEAHPNYRTAFGVGIHSGTLVAGNIGTEARTEYTVIGDTVNVAARIESETKKHDCDILISSSIHDSLSENERAGMRFSSIGKVKVKGREGSLELYRI